MNVRHAAVALACFTVVALALTGLWQLVRR
jgi:hypothetical protein